MMIQVKNLNKSYDKKKVLKEMSFSIPQRRIVALLGPNGSGKTTLFKCLSGITDIDSGEIVVDTDIIDEVHGIKYVMDYPVLYESLTGTEHVKFVLDINKIKAERKEIDRLYDLLQVREFCDQRISEYSLGMKKRIQLLGVILTKPKLLLLDEFISGLDPISLKCVEILLNDYVKEGNTVVLSTHILEIAERICKDVIFIQDGTIIQEVSSIKTISKKYNSIEQYYFHMVNSV